MALKLLFVVNVDWFFLSHRLPIALEAKRQGYEVHVAGAVTNKREVIERHGIQVHPLSLRRDDAGIGATLRVLNELIALFRKLKPDVVHLITIKPILLGGLAARVARVPAVLVAVSGLGFVFVAEGLWACVRRFLVSRLYRSALKHRNRIVLFQNADDRSVIGGLAELKPRQIRMIRGSGVDLNAYVDTPIPEGPPVVLLPARMLADKGVREFVGAARLIKGTSPGKDVGARFVLVGDVDPSNPASLQESEVEEWVREGVVEWWGYRADMPAVFGQASIVVLPSYREGLPKALIEAAACGRAVVTTDVPGCRDAIHADTSGILVPVRNVDALANAISCLLHDRVRCETMGRAGRALAEREFNIEQVVSTHMTIYRELVAGQK